MAMQKTVAFVWENFGPLHVDRCEAVARRGYDVVGIEFASRSNTYDWVPTTTSFEKITLFENRSLTGIGELTLFRNLLPASVRARARHIFLCHYINPSVFFSAVALRALGRRVYTMIDSKFDDMPRNIWLEMLKYQLLLPYQGCLVAGTRSRDYVRFLGMRPERLVPGYDTVAVSRMREGLESVGSPSFGSRHFTIIARLIETKNLKMALDAYGRYVSETANPHRLVVCGSGHLEAELKAQVGSLSLQSLVTFTGFVQTAEVSKVLASTLALILSSVGETFGQVVLEAVAAGVPVLVSEPCGARDELVRTGVNGFVFEQDNPQGLALFMAMLSNDQKLWARMVDAAARFVPLTDVERFADGVERLIQDA